MSDNAASSPREEIAPLAAHEARLYINNLPWSVDNEQLTQWITQETQVKPLEVSVVQNKKYGRSRGYAFIKINKTDMAAALTLNGRHLMDRDIGVQEAANRSDAERAARRAEQAAKREQQRQQRQAQQAAQQSKPNKSAASPSQPTSQAPAQPKKERAQRPKPVIKTFDHATTIHFTNLSFKITSDALRSFVEQAIGVSPVDVTIPVRTGKYRAGQSLGFGFVTVPNDKIDATLALNGQSLEDRVLKVSLAHVHHADQPNDAANNTEAAPREQRPKRRNAGRRARSGKNEQNNGAASNSNNNNNAAPAESAASPSGQQAAGSQPKRNRNRSRRTPRAGAEEGEAQ